MASQRLLIFFEHGSGYLEIHGHVAITVYFLWVNFWSSISTFTSISITIHHGFDERTRRIENTNAD